MKKIGSRLVIGIIALATVSVAYVVAKEHPENHAAGENQPPPDLEKARESGL